MKKAIIFALLGGAAVVCLAQSSRFPPINLYTGDPTGNACTGNTIQQSSTTGLLYTCQSGTMKAGGGGTGTITGVNASTGITGGGSSGSVSVAVDGTAVPFLSNSNTFTGTTNTYTGSLAAKTLAGGRYASQWQTGGGNNGIANGQANSGTLVADPSYGLTEKPGFTSFTSSPIHYQDQRGGWLTDYYRNPETDPTTYDFFPGLPTIDPGPHSKGHGEYCLYDVDLYAGNNANIACLNTAMYSLSAGSNRGNATGITSQPQNWTVQTANQMNFTSRTKGIREDLGLNLNCKAQGDCATFYSYAFAHGGWVDASGEGVKALASNTNENDTQYSGTCSSGCTNGSQAMKLSAANGEQGTGYYLIDATAGVTSSGTFSNVTTSSVVGGVAVTVSATEPVSTAWGVIAGTPLNPSQAVNTPTVNVPPFTTSMTFSVTLGTSPASPGNFAAGQLVCFAGTFHEQAIITSVGAPSGGAQSITVPLRQPHAAGSAVMQGGPCGRGIDFTAYQFNGVRYLWDVIGATDSHTLQVVGFQASINYNNFNQYITGLTGTITLTTATASYGTTVYVTVSGTSSTGGGNGVTYTLSGLTASSPGDSPMNGTCTNVFWNDSTHFTCTHAGLTGTNVTTSTGTIVATQNTYQTWAMAEVTDVRNNTLTPPQADGTIALEPNAMVIANGDNFIELNGTVSKYTAQTNNIYAANPYSYTNGFSLSVQGRGAQGGVGGSVTSNAFMNLSNLNSNTNYSGFGGLQSAPNLMNVSGAYNAGFTFQNAPAPNSSFIRILGVTAQQNDPTYTFTYEDVSTKPASYTKKINLFYGDVTEVVPRLNTIGGILNFAAGEFPGNTYVGDITFAPMSTPTLTVADQTSGGVQADGTYCYRLQARGGPANLFSPQTASDRCGTISGGSGTGSMLLTWTVATGATTYLVFGRTGGSVAQMGSVSGQTNTRFIDNGSVTPSGGVNSTYTPGIINASSLGVVNPNGTTQTKITQSAATTNISLVLSSNAGTLVSTGDSPLFGNHTAVGTTTPVNIDLGATVGTNTAGTPGNCKLEVYSDGTDKYCLGLSAGRLEYQVQNTNTHNFYVNGTQVFKLSTAAADIGSGMKYTINGTQISTASLSDGTSIAKNVSTCGTTTTCANTAQTAPRTVHGNVALTAGSAVVASMTAWTATTSYDCTGTDKTAAAAVQIVNTSTTSITITGTGTDVIAYVCVGN